MPEPAIAGCGDERRHRPLRRRVWDVGTAAVRRGMAAMFGPLREDEPAARSAALAGIADQLGIGDLVESSLRARNANPVVVCNSLGLEHEPVDNHAAYLAHWASHLRSDDGPALVFAASAAATKAATLIVDRIEAHRRRSDAAAEQTQEAAHPGQLVLLPAVAAPEAPERPVAAPEAPERPAAASEQQPAAIPEAPERPVAARAEANGSPSDDASREERLMVARWMMARAKQQGADAERSAAQIAFLLDVDPRDLDGPAQTAPARGRALEVTL